MGGDSRKRFSPRSRAQSERGITRDHNSFARGMFPDLPAVDIPDQAEEDIFNFKNYGRYLETRTGSLEWGNHVDGTPAADLPESYGPFTVQNNSGGNDTDIANDLTDNNYVLSDPSSWVDFWKDFIKCRNGRSAAPANVGDPVGWLIGVDRGGTEEYEGVYDAEDNSLAPSVDGVSVYTRAVTLNTGAVSAVTVYPPIRTVYFSDFHKKFIIHIGGNVYISDDVYVTNWVRVKFYGTPYSYSEAYGTLDISASRSKFVEYKGDIIMFSDSGIYKILIDTDEDGVLVDSYFFKTNTATPTNAIEDIGADTIDPEVPDNGTDLYGRKRVYSYSRLSGNGDRDRQTADVQVEWESGGVSNLPERDYGVQWYVDEATMLADSYSIKGLQFDSSVEDASLHGTHYSIYATRNIEETEGISEEGNNPEELIWEGDYPLAWVGRLEITNVFPLLYSYTPVEGTTIPDATSQYTIVRLGFGGVEYDAVIDKVNGQVYVDQFFPAETIVTVSFGVANASAVTSASGTTITTVDDISASVGSTVFYPDGSNGRVKTIISATQFTVDEDPPSPLNAVGTNIISLPGDVTIGATDYSAGINFGVTDSQLLSRTESYPMTNRFFEPMANGELGDVWGLFAFCSTRKNQVIQYCQLALGFEYLLGQHNPAFQFHNLGDGATDISHFKGVVAVKSLGRTVSFGVNSFETYGNTDAGRFVYVIPYVNEVSDAIGCIGSWAACKIAGTNTEAVVTNEPGLRIFNGTSYSDNIVKDRIIDDLKSFGDNFSVSFSDMHQIVIWGRQ